MSFIKHSILIIVLLVTWGCDSIPHYCRVQGYNLTLTNDYGMRTSGNRSFYGSDFQGTGEISNNNDFAVYIEIVRTSFRNTMPVGSVLVEASNSKRVHFTGGDAFRITRSSGEPIGLLRANVIYIANGKEIVYIGKK